MAHPRRNRATRRLQAANNAAGAGATAFEDPAEYHRLMHLAVNEGDRVAAETALPQASERDAESAAVMAWLTWRGPLDISGEAPDEEGSWEYESQAFLENYETLNTLEGLEAWVKALKKDTDIVEWDGKIDIWHRAPEEVKAALMPPEPTGGALAPTGGALAPANGAKGAISGAAKPDYVTWGLGLTGAALLGYGTYKWLSGS